MLNFKAREIHYAITKAISKRTNSQLNRLELLVNIWMRNNLPTYHSS
jgi:hypothetical protein